MESRHGGNSESTSSDKVIVASPGKRKGEGKMKLPSPKVRKCVPEDWSKCHFYVTKKSRFCKMVKVKDSNYCGEHLLLMQDDEGCSTRRRIRCPHDATHTCFEDSLEIHLRKCTKPKVTHNPEYVVPNANALINKSETKSLPSLSSFDDQRYFSLLEKILKCHIECIDKTFSLPTNNNHKWLQTVQTQFTNVWESELGNTANKHLNQLAGLMNILDSCNLFLDNTVFIEFGSGRGGLTFHVANEVIARGLKKCSFLLVDLTSPRHKKDNKLKNSGINITRIRANIKDLVIDKLPYVNDTDCKHIVGLAKHLCGSATDLAIQSLFNKSNSVKNKVYGCCFATCCHHRCAHDAYFGLDWLLENGFGVEDFRALTQISSWAVNGRTSALITDQRSLDSHKSALLSSLRKCQDFSRINYCSEIGRMVKDILEVARVRNLEKQENNDYIGEIIHYVPESITLEYRVVTLCKNKNAISTLLSSCSNPNNSRRREAYLECMNIISTSKNQNITKSE